MQQLADGGYAARGDQRMSAPGLTQAPIHLRGTNRAERIDRETSRRGIRTVHGWQAVKRDGYTVKTNRHGIGGNSPPEWDPEAPVTGAPMVLRDITPISLPCGTEISSRSGLRAYQRDHGVEQTGMEWTAGSDNADKPAWFDEYKEHRKDNTKRVKAGKAKRKFRKVTHNE
jgi:hypothetical protein